MMLKSVFGFQRS